MHKSAFLNVQKFYHKYCEQNIELKTVLEIGSWGSDSLKQIFSRSKYIGLDMQPGYNVDVVASSHLMPFEDSSIDIIISSSCFEHDPMFWVTFLEMSRILKPEQYMYICAPSSGPYHPEKCPGDSWRFYPDSWKSLSIWAKHNNYNVELIENYIDKAYYPPDENWQDSVGIFKKQS